MSEQKKSHHAPTNVPRLPRSDIPPDHKCPYPECGFQAGNQRGYQQHMVMRHGIYYEQVPKPMKLQGNMALSRTEMQQVEDLAPWHCMALARHIVYGQPFSEVVKEMPGRHSADTIRAIAKSPAGQAFIERCTKELSDPVKLVKSLAKSDTFEMYVMWAQARDWAYAAKDYEALHKMAKDIGLKTAFDDAQAEGPRSITLHLNLNDLAAPNIKSTFTVVEEPEYDILEPDD